MDKSAKKTGIYVIAGIAIAAAVYFIFFSSGAGDNIGELKSGDIVERLTAFKKIEQTKSFGGKTALALVDGGDALSRKMGILLLAKYPVKRDAFAILKAILESGGPDERREAIFALGESGIEDALPVLKSMQVDPDEITRGLVRLAIGKLSRDDRTYPNRADCVYGPAMEELFGTADAEIQPSVFFGEDFISKILGFMKKHTALSVSGIGPGKIKVRDKMDGSSYNSETGIITLGYNDDETPGTLLSQLIHETAVINLGGRERFGVEMKPTFAHDLAVLTETAHASQTCASRYYLSKQINTISSLWTKLAAEETLIRLSIHRNGQKTEPFSAEDLTVYESGAANYILSIEFGPDMELKKYAIRLLK